MPKFTSAYTLRKNRFTPTSEFPEEESLAQESDMEDSDINIIMAKYSRTGMLPQINMEALMGDFSDAPDFRTAQERIKQANEAFAEIPAQLRRRFDNDPQKFIDFVLDDANLEETVKLGYRTAPAKPPESKKVPDNGKLSPDASPDA